jgi:hypothetical protein
MPTLFPCKNCHLSRIEMASVTRVHDWTTVGMAIAVAVSTTHIFTSNGVYTYFKDPHYYFVCSSCCVNN